MQEKGYNLTHIGYERQSPLNQNRVNFVVK